MDNDEFFARLHAGDVDGGVKDFLAANPEISLYGIAMGLTNSDNLDLAELVATYYVKTQSENSSAHLVFAELCRRMGRREDMFAAIATARNLEPDARQVYNQIIGILSQAGEIEAIRETIQLAQENIPDGFFVDTQPGWQLRHLVAPPEKWDRQNDRATAWRNNLSTRRKAPEPNEQTESSEPQVTAADRAADLPDLVADTGPCHEMGTSGACFTAQVSAHADAAEYRFEYGGDPTNLDKATNWQPLPGPQNARATLSLETAPESFRFDAVEANWDEHAGMFLFKSPFAFDTNHLTGLGFLSLLVSVRPMSCQPNGSFAYHDFETYDLRGADYELRLLFRNFKEKDFIFAIGLSSGWAPWMLTSAPVDLENLNGNGDTDLAFHLPSDPAQWTFMGNNPRDQDNAERYAFAPLDRTLSHGTDMIFFSGIAGDWRKAPEGAFGVRDASLRYRSRCVLNPANGAKLVDCNATGDCDPGKLADGNRGRGGDGWYQSGALTEPVRFLWHLAAPVTISTIVLHQDALMPVTQCRLILGNRMGAEDALQVSDQFNIPVDEDPISTIPGKILRLPGDQTFDVFGIEFLASNSPDGIAMEAIEVFAKDFTPPPSRQRVTISQAIDGLTPGETIHYRVACRAISGQTHGNVNSLSIPSDNAPILHELTVFSSTNAKAIIVVRGNAMGLETTVKWHMDDGTWQEIPMGCERTSGHRHIIIRDLDKRAENRLIAKLINEAGESIEKVVTWMTN